MELSVKSFEELSTRELWEIYRLRVSVFVVEQKCPYQEVDGLDLLSFHVMLRDGGALVAYARVMPKNTAFSEVSIGRVLSVKRRSGCGTKIVSAAISTAVERFDAEIIDIGAQTYAKKLYEKLGFRQISDEYSEDGILHIKMRWEKPGS